MKTLLVIISLLLTACASVSVPFENLAPTHKLIRFPDVGQDRAIKAGELLYTFLDYQSNFQVTAFVEEPIATSVGLGSINIGVTEPLFRSVVNKKEMFCSLPFTYRNPFNQIDRSCGVDSLNDGHFDKIYVPSGSTWVENNLDKKVKYRKEESENAASNPQGPLKRELIFDAFESNTLLVTYREFRSSLSVPSAVIPLSFKLTNFDMPIEIKGLRLQIKDAAAARISYQVLTPWESTLKR